MHLWVLMALMCRAGASGGVAAAARVIAPQFIPISQLVLLTVKVQGELRARSKA